jgi:Protein of unknown function (DUF3634)
MAVVLAFSVATLLALVALWWSARGAITICVLDVVDGKVAITKGSLAPRVLSDVEDIVKRPKVRNATLRLSRAKDFAKLEVSGKLSKIQRQQLQNLVGNVPVAKLAGTRRPA